MGLTILVCEDVDRSGFIRVANAAFAAVESNFFGYVAQDAFAGRDWLSIAIDEMMRTGKSLFAFNDGKWQGRLASFGMVRNSWAASLYQGDLFHRGYHSHYADTELSAIAAATGELCTNPYSLLVEVDYEKESKGVNAADRRLYLQRIASNFGLDSLSLKDPKVLRVYR